MDYTHKMCIECGFLKELGDFVTRKGCSDGHINKCKSCMKEKKALIWVNHGHKYNHQKRSKRAVITAKRVASQALVKVVVPEFILKRREAQAQYMKKRLKEIPFKLLHAARNRLWYVLKGAAKAGVTVNLMGCTPEELKAHIEKKFKPGWTWDGWGPIFDIDHIIPCSKFDMRDPEQQRRCFHYTNLQPLEKEINRGSKKILAA